MKEQGQSFRYQPDDNDEDFKPEELDPPFELFEFYADEVPPAVAVGLTGVVEYIPVSGAKSYHTPEEDAPVVRMNPDPFTEVHDVIPVFFYTDSAEKDKVTSTDIIAYDKNAAMPADVVAASIPDRLAEKLKANIGNIPRPSPSKK